MWRIKAMKFFNSGPRVTFDENSNSDYSYPHEDDVTHKEKRINTSYDPNAIPGKSILKQTAGDRGVRFDQSSNSTYVYSTGSDVKTKYDPDAVLGKSILKKTKSSFLSRMVTSIKNGLGRVGAAIVRGVQSIVSGVKGLCYYRARQARLEESSVYGRLNSEEGESHQPEPKQESTYVNYLSVLGTQQQNGKASVQDNSKVHHPLPPTPQE